MKTIAFVTLIISILVAVAIVISRHLRKLRHKQFTEDALRKIEKQRRTELCYGVSVITEADKKETYKVHNKEHTICIAFNEDEALFIAHSLNMHLLSHGTYRDEMFKNVERFRQYNTPDNTKPIL